MLLLDFTILKDHFAQVARLQDPLCLVAVAYILQPGLATDAAMVAVYRLEESILDHGLHRFVADHQLVLVLLVVIVDALAQLVCQLEDFDGG